MDKSYTEKFVVTVKEKGKAEDEFVDVFSSRDEAGDFYDERVKEFENDNNHYVYLFESWEKEDKTESVDLIKSTDPNAR